MNRSLSVVFRSLVYLFLLFVFLSCKREDTEITGAKKPQETEVSENKTEVSENKDEEKEEKINEEELPPPTPKEIGYAYGGILAKAVKMNHLDVDVKAVYKGFNDNIDKQDIDIAPYETILRRAFSEGRKKYRQENLDREVAFLEKNKNAEGVKTLESGLQYKLLKKGDENSAQPKANSKVKIVYSGKVLDAEKEFDSSRGEAIELSLDNVIEGWREVLPLMHIGDEIEVYIPSKMGYGEEGISYSGQDIIPPSALLIFQIELKEIVASEVKEADDTSNADK